MTEEELYGIFCEEAGGARDLVDRITEIDFEEFRFRISGWYYFIILDQLLGPADDGSTLLDDFIDGGSLARLRGERKEYIDQVSPTSALQRNVLSRLKTRLKEDYDLLKEPAREVQRHIAQVRDGRRQARERE